VRLVLQRVLKKVTSASCLPPLPFHAHYWRNSFFFSGDRGRADGVGAVPPGTGRFLPTIRNRFLFSSSQDGGGEFPAVLSPTFARRSFLFVPQQKIGGESPFSPRTYSRRRTAASKAASQEHFLSVRGLLRDAKESLSEIEEKKVVLASRSLRSFYV